MLEALRNAWPSRSSHLKFHQAKYCFADVHFDQLFNFKRESQFRAIHRTRLSWYSLCMQPTRVAPKWCHWVHEPLFWGTVEEGACRFYNQSWTTTISAGFHRFAGNVAAQFGRWALGYWNEFLWHRTQCRSLIDPKTSKFRDFYQTVCSHLELESLTSNYSYLFYFSFQFQCRSCLALRNHTGICSKRTNSKANKTLTHPVEIYIFLALWLPWRIWSFRPRRYQWPEWARRWSKSNGRMGGCPSSNAWSYIRCA